MQTFDRPVIQRWLNEINGANPCTQLVLSHCILTPNFMLQGMISEWCRENGVNLPNPVFDMYNEPLTEAHRHRLRSLLFKLSLSLPEQKAAAKELRELAKRMSAVRTVLGSTQMIKLLMHPLSSGTAPPDPELQDDLIGTFVNLAIHDTNKKLLAENEKVVSFLIDSLKSGQVQTRSNAAAAFASMASLDSNKHIIGRAGAIKYLVDLLEEGDPSAMKDAESALFKLCFVRENIGRTVREGAVQIILGKIVDRILVDEMLSLLALLATHTNAVAALVDHGGVRLLLDILRDTTVESVKENGAVILHLICYHDKEKRVEIKEEEVANGTFSKIVQNGSSRARRKANSILHCLGIGKSTLQKSPNSKSENTQSPSSGA